MSPKERYAVLAKPLGLRWGAVSPGTEARTVRSGGCFCESVLAESGAELSLPA